MPFPRVGDLTRTTKKRTKTMKDKNEIVAVKCEGCFTEWYSPFYKEPYEDNEE